MEKFYIGNNAVLKKFLESYGFINYPINVKEKNIISNLISLRKLSSLRKEKILIVSDGFPAYYSYYASNFFDVTILLNPKFFSKNGYIIKPSFNLISTVKIDNRFILLSNNNPDLNRIKKYMVDEKYIVSDSVVEKMVKIFDNFI